MGLAESSAPGIMLVISSIFIMLYSAFIYYKRNEALVNRNPFGYNDLHGPLLLTFVMIICLILSLLFYD